MKKIFLLCLLSFSFFLLPKNASANSLPSFFTDNFDDNTILKCSSEANELLFCNPSSQSNGSVTFKNFIDSVNSEYRYLVGNSFMSNGISYNTFYLFKVMPFAHSDSNNYVLKELGDILPAKYIITMSENNFSLDYNNYSIYMRPSELSSYSTNFDLYTDYAELLIESSLISYTYYDLMSKTSVALIPKENIENGFYSFSYYGKEFFSGWYNFNESFFVKSTIFDLSDSSEDRESKFIMNDGFRNNYFYVIYNKSVENGRIGYDSRYFELIYFDSPNSTVTDSSGNVYSSPNFIFDTTLTPEDSFDLSSLLENIPQMISVFAAAFGVIATLITMMLSSLPVIISVGFSVAFLLILIVLIIKALK